MKLSERIFEQDGKVVIHQKHDWTPTLDLNERLRSAGADGFSDSKLVGVITPGMMGVWAREAGIRGSDPDYWDKMREIIKRKMLDSENSKLRVWQGNY